LTTLQFVKDSEDGLQKKEVKKMNGLVHFLYKNRFRIFKSVEITIRMGLSKKGEK
jgi:ABC-type proline/glycine betaine transport system ATPase subunit